MEAHIRRMWHVSYFQLKIIGMIQNILSSEALERLVHVIVTVRLDYCNPSLVQIMDASIQKFQLMQKLYQ
jgi:hypothetical protein